MVVDDIVVEGSTRSSCSVVEPIKDFPLRPIQSKSRVPPETTGQVYSFGVEQRLSIGFGDKGRFQRTIDVIVFVLFKSDSKHESQSSKNATISRSALHRVSTSTRQQSRAHLDLA